MKILIAATNTARYLYSVLRNDDAPSAIRCWIVTCRPFPDGFETTCIVAYRRIPGGVILGDVIVLLSPFSHSVAVIFPLFLLPHTKTVAFYLRLPS